MDIISPAIETHHLRKEFNSKVAVADLSLRVERGEVFGFLGANGAGKTTSVKMLLGLISPTCGHGTMLGSPLGDDQTRAKVGFLPEHFRVRILLRPVFQPVCNALRYANENNRALVRAGLAFGLASRIDACEDLHLSGKGCVMLEEFRVESGSFG